MFRARLLLIALLAICALPAGAAERRFIAIGTGAVTGVYFPAGGAICQMVHRSRAEHDVRCGTESTAGSLYNINAIRNGDLDFGIAQSDWQFHAWNGSSRFEEAGPMTELRSVFSLHAEPFTLVAREGSGIHSLADLKGKKVNVGNPGSGQRGTMEVVMEALGWSMDDFALASELKAAEQGQALCDGRVDAIIYTVGHPNGAIKEATTACQSRLIPVDGPEIAALIEANPYYAPAIIPGGTYPGNPADVATFGVKATLVTSARVSDDLVALVARAVMENLEDFRRIHPAFAGLDPAAMVKDGLSAPLHDGARRYYEEAGLLSPDAEH